MELRGDMSYSYILFKLFTMDMHCSFNNERVIFIIRLELINKLTKL